MPKRPLDAATAREIMRLASSGVSAKHIAKMTGVSPSTVSKYRGRRGLNDVDRFEEKFIPEPNSGCWLWTGAATSKGRPYAVVGGDYMPASRAAWSLYRGGVPNGAYVLHNCHNKACVNPAHLRLGSPKDNVADMIKAGRAAEVGDRARAEWIFAYRGTGIPQRLVAEIAGVRQSLVSRIWNGSRWGSIGEAADA